MSEASEFREIPELEGLVTISLAAEIVGVSRQAAHRMVRNGRLQAWRIRSAGNDRPLVVRESEARELARKQKEQVISLPEAG